MDEGLDVSALIGLLEAFERVYGSSAKVYLKAVKKNEEFPVMSVVLAPESVDKDEFRRLLIR